MIINKNYKAFSLIEILVVVSIFAVIGILTTTVLSTTLRTSKKSDSLVRVRESLNYSLASLERQIRNSEKITSPCTGAPLTTISYVSIEGISTQFECKTPGALGYIASGSASLRLTPTDISITACSFSCSQVDANNPPVVRLSISAEDATSVGINKASVTSDTEIVVRNY